MNIPILKGNNGGIVRKGRAKARPRQNEKYRSLRLYVHSLGLLVGSSGLNDLCSCCSLLPEAQVASLWG